LGDLYRLTASQITSGVRNRDFSAEEYICEILDRIEKVEPKVNAFVTVNKEQALNQARILDRWIRDGGNVGPLAGVAVSIKDNICTKGIRTTCGSNMLREYVPPYDATVVTKLQNSGAIIVGKTNLDEFAMGSTTEFSAYGPTRNPWDISRVPGGSSGGSAASVAAQECAVSLGSDTGGSVRCPASFCSIVGIKPTYGLVSRYGLVSYANSLEQISPMGRTVSDAALVLDLISGPDEKDHTTTATPAIRTTGGDIGTGADADKRGLRVGLIKELTAGADAEVSRIVYGAFDLLSSHDCSCTEVSLNAVDYALASYYTIATAEASSNLARYDNLRYGFDMDPEGYEWNTYFAKARSNFGPEAKRRIIVGSYVLSSGYYGKYYLKAQKVRALLKQELKSLYKDYDVLIAPTMPILPFKIGERVEDPLKMYLADVDTVIANLAGIPAMSVPAGFSAGFGVGVQIMADEFKEQTMLQAAQIVESGAGVNRSPDL